MFSLEKKKENYFLFIFSEKKVSANSEDPDATAPKGAVYQGLQGRHRVFEKWYGH